MSVSPVDTQPAIVVSMVNVLSTVTEWVPVVVISIPPFRRTNFHFGVLTTLSFPSLLT